jgi:5-methylcytosine-specific restriction protein B
MGYEDFIEGIKPLKPEEDKPLQYDVTDGLFKKMCVEATFSLLSHISEALPKKIADFEQQYAHFIDIVNERLAKGELIKLKTKSGGIILVDSVSTNNNLIVKHENGGRTYSASFNRLSKLSNAFPDLNNISNIDEEFRKVIGGSNATTNWAVLNGIREMSALIPGKPVDVSSITYESKIEAIRDFKLTNHGAKKIKDAPKHVLIIDEINRGNVAQIFGELITLIEPDKRLGGENYIPMTLAYSKNETFSVPPNLYIIGTMNTADRSVEALDTALRRRFDFIHLQPQAEILTSKIERLELGSMLAYINKRLEVLLDRDHTIGHAWFWNVSNLEALKTVFKNKILPLLQEYFYNDYEKIGLVLGDAFVRSEKTEKGIFAKFTGGNGLADEYSNNSLYYINDIDQLTEQDFASIYHPK